jgi:hypothetical protein
VYIFVVVTFWLLASTPRSCRDRDRLKSAARRGGLQELKFEREMVQISAFIAKLKAAVHGAKWEAIYSADDGDMETAGTCKQPSTEIEAYLQTLNKGRETQQGLSYPAVLPKLSWTQMAALHKRGNAVLCYYLEVEKAGPSYSMTECAKRAAENPLLSGAKSYYKVPCALCLTFYSTHSVRAECCMVCESSVWCARAVYGVREQWMVCESSVKCARGVYGAKTRQLMLFPSPQLTY